MRPVRRYPTLLTLTMWVVILALAAITAQAASSAPFTLTWAGVTLANWRRGWIAWPHIAMTGKTS